MPQPCTPWHVRGCWLAAAFDRGGRYELRRRVARSAALAIDAPAWRGSTTVLLAGGPAAGPGRKRGEPGDHERFATTVMA